MLERELSELRIEWPETPDLAAAVVGRLHAPPRRSWWAVRPAWQVAVAAVALLIAVVMAVPPTRAAVLDLLGLRSVRIEHREPQPSRFGSALALGDPVSLETARRRTSFPLRRTQLHTPPAASAVAPSGAPPRAVWSQSTRRGPTVPAEAS